MADFQNWWDGYFHEINGKKETAQAAWQARGGRIKELESSNKHLRLLNKENLTFICKQKTEIAELTAKLDTAREALKYIDKDLCYWWITESNSIKAHKLISMIMMESSKAIRLTDEMLEELDK